MTESQIEPLTHYDIQAIEARAHEMRAQVMADMLKALARSIRNLPSKLMHLPRHA